jgi:hypothetical protein
VTGGPSIEFVPGRKVVYLASLPFYEGFLSL